MIEEPEVVPDTVKPVVPVEVPPKPVDDGPVLVPDDSAPAEAK